MRVRNLLVVMLLLVLGACGTQATPELLANGRTLTQAQLDEIGQLRCPANLELRVYGGGGNDIVLGYGGRPSSSVRFECVPPGTPQRQPPAEVPPGAVGANGHGATGPVWYNNRYRARHTLPPRFWFGGGEHPNPGYAPNGHRPRWNAWTRQWECYSLGGWYPCIQQPLS